jgi:hypothetical protein
MADINVIRSGEFEMLNVQGASDEGIEFVDAFVPENTEGGPDFMQVVDSGQIVVRLDALDPLLARAKEWGLEVDVEPAKGE